MSSEVTPVKNKIPWLKLAVVAAVAVGGGLLLLRGANPRELFERGMAFIRGAGPAVFFTAEALLPAAGVPVLAFVLTAGPIFGDQLGMGLTVALSVIAITVNMVVTYFLARRALRPLLEKLITRLGYKLPQVDAGDVTDLVMILRLTPGIPFCVQNYLLGLAEMPFAKYILISCLISCPQNAAIVLFGDALMKGKGKMLLIAGSLVAVAAVATHMARKHYARKKVAV
jgi:uncharacterized membrane protein YdjX (TVP38/TMEM64 family)